MRKITISLITTLTLVMFSKATLAAKESVSVEVGTLGIGVSRSFKMPFTNSNQKSLSLRFALNYYDIMPIQTGLNKSYSYTEIYNDGLRSNKEIKTTGSIRLLSTFVDWYPANNNFRITFGVAYNGSNAIEKLRSVKSLIDANGDGKANKRLTINKTTELSFDKLSSYVGIGYGNNTNKKRGFRFNMSLGVLAQNPDVSVKVSGEDADLYSEAAIKNTKDKILKADYYSKLSNYVHLAIGLEYKL